MIRAALALCRRHLAAAALFSALVNLLYIAPTLYMLQVYDRVVPTQGLVTLLFLTLVLLFALATLALLDRVRARLLVRASVLLDTTLVPAVLDATLGHPDAPRSRQALRDLDLLRQLLSGPAMPALFDVPWTPIYILVCFLVHPLIGVVGLFGAILLPFIAWCNERALRPRLEQARIVAGDAYAAQEAILGSADTVRALGMRRAMVRRQRRQREAMLLAQTAASFAAGGYLAATKFVRLALQSLALGVGAMLAVRNEISAGMIFAASFLVARAFSPIEQLIAGWATIVQARGSYRGLSELLGAVGAGDAATRLPRPAGAVELDQLTILNAARDAPVLHAISLRIDPGEVVAIIGPSGAGKSTLARVIAGALRPDRGAVRIDGAEQRDWDPERLAGHLGYLPQDSALFAGTVKENICRFATELEGDQEAIDAAVVAAARAVGAEELILRLPGGYDHRLQLHGRGVSAGQAQRIALARAAFGSPAILILDEPNAHLDPDGDAQLLATLARLKAQGTTVLIVSHKLGILPVIDKILVLRGGRVELFGPRDEVLPKIARANVRRMTPQVATA